MNNTIKENIGDTVATMPTNDLFPLVLLENTRGYIEICGKQAMQCYDYGFFDATLLIIRNMIETLLIELFKKLK